MKKKYFFYRKEDIANLMNEDDNKETMMENFKERLAMKNIWK